MADWISVKDRLPELGETVLCRREDGVEFVDANFWFGHNGIDFWKPIKGIIDYGCTGEMGERGASEHQLKILPQYFQAVWSMINCENCRRYKKSCTGGLAKEQCEKIKLPQTEADRIRAMSDEELADWAWGVETAGRAYGPRDEKAWLDWLKQEADNG